MLELTSRPAARARSDTEATRLRHRARANARGRGAEAMRPKATKLEELAERCEKVAKQIDRRVTGLEDHRPARLARRPDARPIRKGKLGLAPTCADRATIPRVQLGVVVIVLRAGGLFGLGPLAFCRDSHRPSRNSSSLSAGW